jgi:hypothetical protein
MKLRDLLEQLTIELNVPKPEDAYPIEKEVKTNLGYGDFYIYPFKNSNGDLMEVTCLITKFPKEPGKSIFIAFGLHDPDKDLEAPPEDDEEEKKYKTQTGAGDMLKVMATVVEAVRRTFKKIGGEDKVYAIRYAPADIKRKNIYDHYIKTLFPNFEKDLNSSSTGFTVLINQDFKAKEVNEIGLDSEKMKPYRFTTVEDEEDRRVYTFKTDSGLNYMVELDEEENEDYGMVLYINFGVVDEEEITMGSNQNVVTNKGEQYRVMNTLSAIVKEDLAINSYIKYITFNPAKRKLPNPISGKERDLDSNSRAKLYMKYIIGRLPNAKEIKHPNYPILIKIK